MEINSCKIPLTMKLDYLSDISNGGQIQGVISDEIVRLFDFNFEEAILFRDAIQTTIIEKNESLNCGKLTFIELINCNLIFTITETDEGIVTNNNIHFNCQLSIPAYKQMLELLQPFCQRNASGYQYLYDLDNPIELLFAPGGSW